MFFILFVFILVSKSTQFGFESVQILYQSGDFSYFNISFDQSNACNHSPDICFSCDEFKYPLIFQSETVYKCLDSENVKYIKIASNIDIRGMVIYPSSEMNEVFDFINNSSFSDPIQISTDLFEKCLMVLDNIWLQKTEKLTEQMVMIDETCPIFENDFDHIFVFQFQTPSGDIYRIHFFKITLACCLFFLILFAILSVFRFIKLFVKVYKTKKNCSNLP